MKRPQFPIYCSFCGRTKEDTKKIIAGPAVYICDECIRLCNIIMADDSRRTFALGDGI